MFALALWDRERRTLLLARDRAGEKPLYYRLEPGPRSPQASGPARGSRPRPRLDRRALVRYLTLGWIRHRCRRSPACASSRPPTASSTATGGRKSCRATGTWRCFPARGPGLAAASTPSRRSSTQAGAGRAPPLAQQVPALASSSRAASIRRRFSPTSPKRRPVSAVTLGHTDRDFDEAGFAAATARHFGADLHSLVLSRDDLAEGLRWVGQSLDVPLGDASTIPTALLSRFAGERVKVVLSGEGADELFGGYPTYLGHRLADRLAHVPRWLRHGIVGGIRRLLPVSMGNVGLDYLVERFAAGADLDRRRRHEVWFGSVDPARLGDLLAPGLRWIAEEGDGVSTPERALPDPLAELLYADFTGYLQDDLLTKVDRATMLASIEARAPFLDHELAEFVAGIPSRHKVRGLTTKAILRRTVRHRLPAAVLERRKRGFNIPFSRWVLEGLGEELRRRFSPERAEARGLFSSAGVGRLLDEHLERRADHRKPLFALLAFDQWCDRTFGEAAPVPIELGQEQQVAALEGA
ncbi:MAG: asparagine synthase-related protein [Thermoanaerobaculia bacterium]